MNKAQQLLDEVLLPYWDATQTDEPDDSEKALAWEKLTVNYIIENQKKQQELEELLMQAEALVNSKE